MSGRRCAIGEALGPFRRINLVLELSEVQIHQAGNDGRKMSASRLRRRNRRQEIAPRKTFLRLLELSEVRHSVLGQADPGELSAVRQAFPVGENDQEGHYEILF